MATDIITYEELVPEMYDKVKGNEYIGRTGSEKFYWTTITSEQGGGPPDNWNTADGSGGQPVTYQRSLNSDQFDIKNMGLYGIVQMSKVGGSNPLTAGGTWAGIGTFSGANGDNCTFHTDCWIDTIRVQINGVDISATTGKTYAYKAAHIKRLLQETPDYNMMIRGGQWAYVDSGTGNLPYTDAAANYHDLTCGASCDRVKFIQQSSVVTVPIVGTIGANGALAVNTNGAALPAGSPVIAGVAGNGFGELTESSGVGTISGGNFTAFYNQNVIAVGQTAVPILAAGGGTNDSVAAAATGAQPTVNAGVTSFTDVCAGAGGLFNAAGTAGQAGVALSYSADGNPYFFIDENPNFNAGFYKKCIRTKQGYGVAIWIPLRYYCHALEAFDSLMTNFTLRVEVVRPNANIMCFEPNLVLDATGGAAIYTQYPFAGYPYFQKLELHVPTYTPNETMRAELSDRLAKGITTIRKYVDIDVFQVNTAMQGTTSNNVVYNNAVSRKPIGVLVGFQTANDTGTGSGTVPYYAGNPHRYFNVGMTSAYISINNQNFPYQPLVTNNNYGASVPDSIAMWRELMKFANVEGNNQACLIDHPAFVNHKCLYAFDTRECQEIPYQTQGSQPITFVANWNYNIPSTPATFNNAAAANGVAAGWNNGLNGRFLGELPVGVTNVWFFVVQERAVSVYETTNNVAVLADVITAD